MSLRAYTPFVFFSIFIYLAMPGLSCNTWDLISCSLRNLGPWPGLNPGPPALGAWSFSHWSTGKALKHLYLMTDCSHPVFWGGESDYSQYLIGSSGLMDLLCVMHKPPSPPRPRSKPEVLSQMRLCNSPETSSEILEVWAAVLLLVFSRNSREHPYLLQTLWEDLPLIRPKRWATCSTETFLALVAAWNCTY